MKKVAILLTSLLIAFVTGCQDHNLEPHPEDVMAWRAGGAASDQGEHIATDHSGNVYVAGYFTQSAIFGSKSLTSPAGGVTIFIAKYSPTGEILWVQQPTATSSSSIGGMTVDASGNVYLTGSFRGRITFGTVILNSRGGADIFTVKLNSSGEAQWGRNEGSSSDYPFTSDIGNGIAADEVGNVYVTGSFNGTATFGSTSLTSRGSSDLYTSVFITKYNSNGDVLWAQQAGGTDFNGGGRGVAVDESGNAYITGYFRGTADFGTTTLTSGSRQEIFTAKYSNTGEVIWAQQGDVGGSGTAIAVDKNGNAYVTGQMVEYRFDSQIYFAKYNTNGERQWSYFLGTIGMQYRGEDIAVDKDENVYLISFNSSPQLTYVPYPRQGSGPSGSVIDLVHYGDADVFVGKFDSHGNLLWTKTAGGTGNDNGQSIAIDYSGTVYITGSFEHTATFGITSLTSSSGSDIFVAKFKQ
ncbi:SBBP repeat-containing protein [Telluribacter sp. SYSU D00476]|uniref:SBBP repeat-containing protein n=1 Tax=Telluribacter sp. SYSU D00476 TaxID=2811430 RepID=UPI001FF3577A|nr:SBBP repeat-containing protein [Telluribacter sp. SYSU D00476]